MADGHQSPRMRTRRQNRVLQPGDESLDGATSETERNLEERSSVNPESGERSAELSAQQTTSFLNMEEPVLTVNDKRIRTLMAQTTTEKMRLDNAIRELTVQAQRHQAYQEEGEDSDFLIDRAIQLKRNMQKAEQIENSLISNLSNLTSLLEMLNLEGEESQRKKGVELSNKVAQEIEKYSGKTETFHHNNKATLKFALPKKTVQSSDNSQSSSRNSSIERRVTRMHDH